MAPLALVRAADLPFLAFVLGLGIVVQAVTGNGLGAALAPLLPTGTCPRCWPPRRWPPPWPTWPTTCRPCWSCCRWPRRPAPAPCSPCSSASTSAPTSTYTGSLATLLWRRIAQHHGSAPDLGEFTRLGLLTAPAALTLGVLALWAGLHLLGG